MKLNSTREYKIINALGTTLSYKGSKHINGNRSNEIFSVIPTQFPTHWTLTLTGSYLQPLKKAFWVSLLEKKNIIRTLRWVLKDSTVGKIPSKSSKTYRIERCRPKVKYFPISPCPHPIYQICHIWEDRISLLQPRLGRNFEYSSFNLCNVGIRHVPS